VAKTEYIICEHMKKENIFEILNKSYFSAEMDEYDVITHLKDLGKINLFVDIGASLGQYTYFMDKIINKAEIITIEADIIRYDQLCLNCKKWLKDSANTIKCIHSAISDINGDISFFSTNSNVSGGLFKHNLSHLSNDQKKDVNWNQITVPGIKLDTLFNTKIPDLIKIDIEGSELRALKGAENLLKAGKTVFLIEVHNWHDPRGQKGSKEVFEFLLKYNYKPYFFFGKTLFVKNIHKRLPGLWFKLQFYKALNFINRVKLKLVSITKSF